MPYKLNPFTGYFDRVANGSPSGNPIETITGDTGGAVSPDGAFNIFLLGNAPLTVTGSPGTNTLTIDQDGTLATTFTADSGSATPSSGNLNVLGGTLTSTSGASDTITINLDDNVVGTILTDSGSVTPSSNTFSILGGTLLNTSGATSIVTVNADDNVVGSVLGDSGTATPVGNAFTIAGGTLLSSSASSSTVTISLQSTVASIYDCDSGSATPAAFTLDILGGTGCSTTGSGSTVTIDVDGSIPASFPTDSGTATPAANALTIAGGTGCSTSGSGSTVTIDVDGSIPASFPTDSGTATPAANALTIAGGTGISTSGAAATVTIALDTPVSVADGGSGRTSATAYAVICGGTTSTDPHQSIVSVGTAGQVLTSNGAGALPTFEDATGGGVWNLISTATASSSASVTFTSGIDNTYNTYAFILNSVVPATDGVYLRLRVSTDGGSSYLSTGYATQALVLITGGLAGTTSTTEYLINTTTTYTLDNTANRGISGVIYLSHVREGTNAKISGVLSYLSNNALEQAASIVSGRSPTGITIDAFEFTMSSGNISTGDISLYGITQ